MNYYESIYILKADINEADYKDIIEKLTSGINTDKVKDLGVKNLAYEVRGNKKGRYAMILQTGTEEQIQEKTKIARLEDNVIKFINIKSNEIDYIERLELN